MVRVKKLRERLVCSQPLFSAHSQVFVASSQFKQSLRILLDLVHIWLESLNLNINGLFLSSSWLAGFFVLLLLSAFLFQELLNFLESVLAVDFAAGMAATGTTAVALPLKTGAVFNRAVGLRRIHVGYKFRLWLNRV